MVKLLWIPLLLILLSGCDTFRIKTETQEVKVPVLYCPAPPAIVRPDLPIQLMTEEQKNSAGELVKHWKATTVTLLGYSMELEKALDQYNSINISYDEMKAIILGIDQSKPTE